MDLDDAWNELRPERGPDVVPTDPELDRLRAENEALRKLMPGGGRRASRHPVTQIICQAHGPQYLVDLYPNGQMCEACYVAAEGPLDERGDRWYPGVKPQEDP